MIMEIITTTIIIIMIIIITIIIIIIILVVVLATFLGILLLRLKFTIFKRYDNNNFSF